LYNSSIKNTDKNGYKRVCRGDKKTPYIFDHWIVEYNNMKDDSEKGMFKLKTIIIDSYAAYGSRVYCQEICSIGPTTLDSQHIKHIIA
jgi:hypothetical protein